MTETLPAVVKRHRLTERGIRAAQLDAQGYSAARVAEITGFHPNHLTKVRGWPEYQAERQRYLDWEWSAILLQINAQRLEALEAGNKALEQLVVALAAEDGEGRPLLSVRVEAARAILNSPIMKTLAEAPIEGAAPPVKPGAQAPSTYITLKFRYDDEGQRQLAAIDGKAVEELESRAPHQEGNDLAGEDIEDAEFDPLPGSGQGASSG